MNPRLESCLASEKPPSDNPDHPLWRECVQVSHLIPRFRDDGEWSHPFTPQHQSPLCSDFWSAWRRLPRLHRMLVQAHVRGDLAAAAALIGVSCCDARHAAHRGVMAITFLTAGAAGPASA